MRSHRRLDVHADRDTMIEGAIQHKYSKTLGSLKGDEDDMSPPHQTVGVLFSPEFLVSRLEFQRVMPDTDSVLFDRTWRDKKAKAPA